jgi:hypothetical protein
MAGSSRYNRSDVEEIESRLRSLEKTIEKLGSRTSSQARDTAGGLADAVAPSARQPLLPAMLRPTQARL